jgi:hypothetical protein
MFVTELQNSKAALDLKTFEEIKNSYKATNYIYNFQVHIKISIKLSIIISIIIIIIIYLKILQPH